MKHRIVTAAQMKEIEQAGDAHGLPYLQMMENAGLAAYAELQKQFLHPGRLLVVCGKGNNGGDGFVIARAAAKDGWNVRHPRRTSCPLGEPFSLPPPWRPRRHSPSSRPWQTSSP